MHVVVVSFDRWSLGFLGCYGNPEVQTPSIDKLATRAVVFDQHFAENLSGESDNHAWWTGRFQFPLQLGAQAALRPIFGSEKSADLQLRFLLEENSPIISQVERFVAGVGEIDVAPLREVLGDAAGRISSLNDLPDRSSLLWVHMQGPRFSANVDDYIAQSEAMDAAVGELLTALEQLPESAQPLLMMTAAEGEVVLCDGEAANSALAEERVHCPLLVSIPGAQQMGSRRQALTQAVDIGPTLADWLDIAANSDELNGASLLPLIEGDVGSVREYAYYGANGRAAARDQNYLLIRDEVGMTSLFLKPEDRYERADAAAQYGDVAEELDAKLTAFLRERE